MRATHLFVFVLAFGLANAQLSGMISGLVEGLVEGGIKGVVGAYAPLVKEGMSLAYNLFQTKIRVDLQLIEQLGKAAPVLYNTITNTISGIFTTGMNLIKGFTGASHVALHAVRTSAQHGVTGGFASFAQLKAADQKSIAGVFGNVNQVFVTVTKLKLESLKKADKEVPAMRKVLESQHKNPQQLFAALKAKAPKLTDYVQTVHSKAVAEFHLSSKKLQDSAKKGLTMIQDSFRLSKKGIEASLNSMNPTVKKEFGPMFHLLNNGVHVANAAF